MKLPLPGLFEKKEKIEYFFATLLREEKIKIILFEEINAKIKVIAQHEEHFGTSLEEAPINEWVTVFDKAIGAVEKNLPDNITVQKTVFGVKQTWTDEGRIKKEYLLKLKKVSEELELEPIGFLVFSEAIAHLLHKEQGAPVSGILVEIGTHTATVTILRAGKIIEIQSGKLEDSAVQTVDTLLKHVTNVEILPSKIILFDGDHHAQNFTKHEWNKHLPFLHTPHVTVLDKNFDSKAIIEGTAAQLGFQVIEEEQFSEKHHESERNKELPSLKEQNISHEKHSDMPEEAEELLGMEALGFMKDTDVATLETPPMQSPEKIEALPAEPTLGEKETLTTQPFFATVKEKIMLMGNYASKFIHRREKREEKIGEGLFHDQAFVEEPRLPRTPGKKIPKLVFIIPAVLIVIVAGFVWYIMSVKANVAISLNPKILTEEQTITFSTDSDTNVDGNIIHGTPVDISEEGTSSTQATGSKDIGTPAKGTVTIFNNNDTQKTLSGGTTITSSNGLKFTLDKEVTIASASGDIFSGTKPGTTDAAVTAEKIGQEYNLPSSTKFSFSGSSSLAAKNNSAFSGGTKKQATVVAQADVDKLLKDLPENLLAKAKDKLNQQAGSDNAMLPIVTKSTIEKKKFDKNVGDEAKTVTLTATVSFKSMAYDKNDLKEIGLHTMRTKTADSLKLLEDSIQVDLHDITAKNEGIAKAGAIIEGSFASSIDTNTLQKDIAGKSFDEAQQILSGIPQYRNAEFTLSPDLFFLPKQLPKFSNNITITIQTK